MLDLFIVYESDIWLRNLNTNFILATCLSGTVNLTKINDIDKYGYNGYCIGFGARSQFALPAGKWDENTVIFGVEDNSSLHSINRKKDIPGLGEDPTD